ncbi:hypothetical protein OAL00_00785 [Verrucomicrobiales bacterium]|nr:hypothetical protein [Verrucomicrobiales bacterium]
MVLDDTASLNISPSGEITIAMGGGTLQIRKPGRSGVLLKYVNKIYKPMRSLDRNLTDHRFYWIPGGGDWNTRFCERTGLLL